MAATFDYARTRATAERLIARFGQVGALRRTTDDGDIFNPTQTTADHACTFAVLDYAKSMVDGTLIKQTDQMVYLSTSGLAITPETTDRLVVGGTWSGSPLKLNGAVMTIVNVKPLSPAGTVVFWELQVRR
ncbi:hypothetical protein ACWX0K_15005 [Nitrobacteraceae bacterium UC4446_H13]